MLPALAEVLIVIIWLPLFEVRFHRSPAITLSFYFSNTKPMEDQQAIVLHKRINHKVGVASNPTIPLELSQNSHNISNLFQYQSHRTHIIGHYNLSVGITTQFLTSHMLCVNFTPNDRFLKNTMATLFIICLFTLTQCSVIMLVRDLIDSLPPLKRYWCLSFPEVSDMIDHFRYFDLYS